MEGSKTTLPCTCLSRYPEEKRQLVLRGLLVGVTTLLVFAALLVFAVGASKTCQKYAWDKADTSHFFVNQGFLSAIIVKIY